MEPSPSPNAGDPADPDYARLVDAVTDCALCLLTPDGVLRSWNRGAQQVLGHTPGEALGRPLADLFTDEDREAGLPARWLEAARVEGHAREEGWMRRHDGTPIWAERVLDLIPTAHGAPLGLALQVRDLSERHARDLLQDEQRMQLFHAQKLEALGQLSGGLAQDFNELLTIILSASALAGRSTDETRRKELLGHIHEAGLRGRHLTQHLQAFAGRREQQVQVLQLEGLLHTAQMFFIQALPRHLTLELQVRPPLHPVEVDFGQLEMSLLNLVFNARDAMPPGEGTIVLRAENRYLDGSWDDLVGSFVRISVSDEGSGIPEAILPRIFEPFFTTKPLGEGTGLGLSQAWGFARQQGGGLRVESQPGQGAILALYLPAWQPGAAANGRNLPEADDSIAGRRPGA